MGIPLKSITRAFADRNELTRLNSNAIYIYNLSEPESSNSRLSITYTALCVCVYACMCVSPLFPPAMHVTPHFVYPPRGGGIRNSNNGSSTGRARGRGRFRVIHSSASLLSEKSSRTRRGDTFSRCNVAHYERGSSCVDRAGVASQSRKTRRRHRYARERGPFALNTVDDTSTTCRERVSLRSSHIIAGAAISRRREHKSVLFEFAGGLTPIFRTVGSPFRPGNFFGKTVEGCQP